MKAYSITRLLVMKKSVEKELERLLDNNSNVVSTTVKTSTSKEVKDALRKKQKAFLDKLNAAMSKRDKIASAISKSNAEAEVTVAGVKMTVAAAIDRKNNIEKEKRFCNLLSSAGVANERALARAEQTIEREASERAQTLSGRDKAPTAEVLKAATDAVKDLYAVEVIEPANVYKLAVEKREAIDLFLEDVDIALNESNATTMVELDLAV